MQHFFITCLCLERSERNVEKYENGQYLINMGEGGFECYQVGVGGYRVDGQQVIIDGYIEQYEDDSLLKLVELQKIEVIGERNEKSSIGHFKLKKIQIVEGGLTQ